MPKSKSDTDPVLAKNQEEIVKKLTENLVELQKVHTNMAEKFDNLSKQIAQLLSLFEMAARSFAQHPSNQVAEKDTEFLDKIDKLLEQNKTIAKGLTLMEERVREKVYGPQSAQGKETTNEEYQPSQGARPLPKF